MVSRGAPARDIMIGLRLIKLFPTIELGVQFFAYTRDYNCGVIIEKKKK